MSDPTTGRSRRRGPRWVRLDQGVHRPAIAEDVFLAELLAWVERLPADAVVTGLTAARVWGLWLPPLPGDLPVFVAVGRRSTHSKRGGVRVFRETSAPTAVVRNGLRVAPVPEVLLACARDLGLLDLAVLVDSALRSRLCTLAELHAAASRGRRGGPRLRETLPWCDARSESAWETLLRILHLACGVPVEPQAVLRSSGGDFVARADLLVVGTRTIQEYDGVDHLDRRRYGKDRRRDSRLAAAGYTRHGWVAEHVLTQAVGILREADRALGRPHDPGRVRGWYQLLKASLFSEAGTAAFRRRVGLVVEETS